MTLYNINHCYCFTTLRACNDAMVAQLSMSFPDLAMVINSINGLNNVEIGANDAHEMAASEALLRLRGALNLARTFFSAGNT